MTAIKLIDVGVLNVGHSEAESMAITLNSETSWGKLIAEIKGRP